MAELVADCPRCNSVRITFNVSAEIFMGKNFRYHNVYEVFGKCRACGQGTIYVITDRQSGGGTPNPTKVEEIAINSYYTVDHHISTTNMGPIDSPEHLPQNIDNVFQEGAICLAAGCHNAAATMFRLCIDLATSPLLPDEKSDGLDYKTRRDLGLRLPWLFKNHLLPQELHDLSSCIKDDGNDAAHRGNITEDDTEDLLDFTIQVLERLYTNPQRIILAKQRSEERKKARRGD